MSLNAFTDENGYLILKEKYIDIPIYNNISYNRLVFKVGFEINSNTIDFMLFREYQIENKNDIFIDVLNFNPPILNDFTDFNGNQTKIKDNKVVLEIKYKRIDMNVVDEYLGTIINIYEKCLIVLEQYRKNIVNDAARLKNLQSKFSEE